MSALAEAFDRRPLQLRRTAARLYARGLLRWRDDAATKEAVFGITPAGRAMVRPLLSVGAGLDGSDDRPAMWPTEGGGRFPVRYVDGAPRSCAMSSGSTAHTPRRFVDRAGRQERAARSNPGAPLRFR